MGKDNSDVLPKIPEDRFFLERFRIHAMLEKALESYIVIISAGEGYGKTCAVNSFLRKYRQPTVWILLSERDNQPVHFWKNYTGAMGQCRPAPASEMRKIGFPKTERQFKKWSGINRTEFGAQKQVIVLDDFHCIRPGPVLDFFQQAMRSPVPNQTLILIGRTEPSFNMTSMLLKGSLTRIGADDLLFNEQEVADYFKLWNIALSGEDSAAIYRDTEGWALALGIVATELSKNSYLPSLSEKSIFRIFADDLFASVSGEIRNYLIKLSLFEQWPLELLRKTAASLSEPYREISALVTELEKLGTLVTYDYYLRGYQIHRVFLEYLREKLKNIPGDQIREMRALASTWCLENNLKMDAAIHFERMNDYAGLADIIDSFPCIIPQSTAASLLEMINRLLCRENRDEADENFLYLCKIVRGRLLMSLTRFEEAVAVFGENIRQYEALPPDPLALKMLAESWHYLGTIRIIQRRFEAAESYIHCYEQAGKYYQMNPWPLKNNITVFNISSYVIQVACPAAPGEFERHISLFAQGVHRAANPLNGYLSGVEELARAELAYFQGALDTAEQYARGAVIRAHEKSQYEIETRGIFFLIRICLHRGTLETLQELWRQSEAMLSVSDNLNRSIVNDINNGWLYTQLGYPEKTAAWLRSRFEESDLFSMFRNFELMAKAKYLYAEKQYRELVAFLDQGKSKNSLGTFLLGVLEMNCLEIAARYHLGEEAAALELLEKTYRFAAPHSLNMPFIELGGDMRSLAGLALNANSAIPRPWLEDIRSRASAYRKNLFTIAEQFRGEEKTGKMYLTRQEQIVLDGLSRGQTREEIAAAIGQPMSAVKSIATRVCGKIGANNRADAVRIASMQRILRKSELASDF
jgi:LuxR family maltose regulon positive regulatory protein